jgi:hypothetical protein
MLITVDAVSELAASESASIMLSTSWCLCFASSRIFVISSMVSTALTYTDEIVVNEFLES